FLPTTHHSPHPPSPLEKTIQSFHPQLQHYQQLKQQPNYLQPHNHIIPLNQSINQLQNYIHEIPQLITQAQKQLPPQFQHFKYVSPHLNIDPCHLDHLKIHAT
ncbi:septation ring formation regulator EzrA, partial [Staphylococcus haemolyticus]|uniref:septation ring formation regulator EzrA n=1 Tax=Staphylococcus haemolyticus TaxID=1283 RepID=UPI00374F0BA1